MTPEQIDIALSELETRLDRLRALYEQYFMGIERLEPQVPRKDVERRFHELRKTPFRNTARRFKFQTLSQRYSTMVQYWTRICREIENGTYKRHRLRAERSQGAEERNLEGVLEAMTTAEEARADAERELGSLLDDGVDAQAELAAALRAASEPVHVTETETRLKSGLLGRLGGAASPAVAAGGLGRLNAGPALPPLPGRPSASEPRTSEPNASTSDVLGRPPVPRRPSAPPPRRPSVPPPRRPSSAPAERSGPPLPPPRPPSSTGPRPPLPPPRDALRSVEIDRASLVDIPRAAPAAASASLSEDRIRALHKSYLEARAQTNASAVSFEKLAQNVRETERKLREQHRGKDVDFEVQVRDGKAILKPRVR